MAFDDISGGYGISAQKTISHYRLDTIQCGSNHHYIWRHRLAGEDQRGTLAVLVDLNNLYIPDHEMEKLVFSLVMPDTGMFSVAIANCHKHNQQELKRRLKAHSLKLYSKTAFFMDPQQAMQWLRTQNVS